uniref:Micro-fibrillar-associated protein 1 C-terminal domain-containing protein n=1 Tax=Zooxanthella nutricula TaxID=1333877 RepID=A0A6U6R515_9DINO|mmetsp:Transcript_68992/g.211642  ORF Transcript_68992/g.211642 Transcript_68992/m.211642 type:complete len:492 (+) Transcript_68992:71-1546(+)
MSVEYQNSILWRGEDPTKRKPQPKVDASKKTVRYFPGKAPRWAEEEKKAAAKEKDEEEALHGFDRPRERSRDRRRRRRLEPAAAIIEERKEDPAAARLKRLQASSTAAEPDASERLRRHRQVHEARVLEAAEELKDEEVKKEEQEELQRFKKEESKRDDNRGPVAELQIPMYDDISGDEAEDVELRTLRRERAREAALQKMKEDEEGLGLKEEAEDDDDDDDEDSDESDSDPRHRSMLKPVFVSKSQRETVKEREAQQKEEEKAKEREKQRADEKKAETKGLLVDTIRADDLAEQAADENDRSDAELPDDNDETNEAEEYELWKIRELKRIKRDKEERLERQKELELIEKRRMMTDAEREEDDRRMDAESTQRDEVKGFNFLQKYYHRGGFFQDKATTGEEPLYTRDYHEPLEEEKFDKNMLPKAMQLRRGQFGKKGQVKHTHLTEVDTTDKSAAWAQQSRPMQKYQEKMAAAKGVNAFDRPSGSSSSRPL